jgi:ADP-ribosylation factor GTPase-activating protein 2/3
VDGADIDTVWQWDQLRIMKMGGNESATKYFQSHGGSAALASKDHKAKYTSNAATKYKEELTRRCAADAKLYVLINAEWKLEFYANVAAT